MRRTQQLGAHHRRKSQSHHRRDHHRHGDRHRKLSVELTGDARQEAHRHEYRAQHERHGHKSAPEVFHRLGGSLKRRYLLGVHYTIHILHHHDGVVDHYADGEYQTEKGQHIEREAEYEHHSECAHERDRHGDDRYQCGAPVLKRQEHHGYHQQQRLEKRSVDMMDRLLDICRHVERYAIAYAGREAAGYHLHLALYSLGHLHGVGAGEHIDVDHSSIAAVDTALGGIARGLKRHPGHITQTYHRAVVIGTQHDILELFDRRQAAAGYYGHGHIDIGHWRLSECSGGRLAVLILQGILHILDRQAEIGELIGLDPYLHCIVAASDTAHTAYTWNTAYRVYDIKGGIVAQIHLVELRIIAHDGDCHQTACRLLRHRDAVLHHLGRKPRLGLLDTVLYIHGRKLGIDIYVKRHQSRKTARIGA